LASLNDSSGFLHSWSVHWTHFYHLPSFDVVDRLITLVIPSRPKKCDCAAFPFFKNYYPLLKGTVVTAVENACVKVKVGQLFYFLWSRPSFIKNCTLLLSLLFYIRKSLLLCLFFLWFLFLNVIKYQMYHCHHHHIHIVLLLKVVSILIILHFANFISH
jgi:glycosyltransferase involved in cell wall biosynthesis